MKCVHLFGSKDETGSRNRIILVLFRVAETPGTAIFIGWTRTESDAMKILNYNRERLEFL